MEIKTSILQEIKEELNEALQRAGIMYRLFARGKDSDSFYHKINSKPKDYYSKQGKRIQDILGLRIIFYFREDVNVFCEFLKNGGLNDKFDSISDSEEDFYKKYSKKDDVKYEEWFCPQRLNLVFKMEQSRADRFFDDIKNCGLLNPNDVDIIDSTYEIQLRSVLSEGWHEVEHDLRYKCQNDPMWEYCREESRALNGVFAALETNERAMELLFQQVAYKNYKNKNWESMIRNHFRVKLNPSESVNPNIKVYLDDSSNRIAKSILSFPRSELQKILMSMSSRYPISYDNIIYLINRLSKENSLPEIVNLEPHIIKNKLDKYLEDTAH